MGKYLIRANYTQAGLAGLLKEGGTQRREALKQTVEGAGGALESLYYAFGARDLYNHRRPSRRRNRNRHLPGRRRSRRLGCRCHRAPNARDGGRGGQEGHPLQGAGSLDRFRRAAHKPRGHTAPRPSHSGGSAWPSICTARKAW